jgi:hypothetical protein
VEKPLAIALRAQLVAIGLLVADDPEGPALMGDNQA